MFSLSIGYPQILAWLVVLTVTLSVESVSVKKTCALFISVALYIKNRV